jgi:ribosomal protein L40E
VNAKVDGIDLRAVAAELEQFRQVVLDGEGKPNAADLQAQARSLMELLAHAPLQTGDSPTAAWEADREETDGGTVEINCWNTEVPPEILLRGQWKQGRLSAIEVQSGERFMNWTLGAGGESPVSSEFNAPEFDPAETSRRAHDALRNIRAWEQGAKKTAGWQCYSCAWLNPHDATTCEFCHAPKRVADGSGMPPDLELGDTVHGQIDPMAEKERVAREYASADSTPEYIRQLVDRVQSGSWSELLEFALDHVEDKQRCTHCGKEYPAEARVCPDCGQEQDPVTANQRQTPRPDTLPEMDNPRKSARPTTIPK